MSDILSVYDGQGNLFAQASVLEVNEDPTAIYFINIAGLIDPNEFGNATSLIEPSNGAFSDIFGIANVGLPYLVLAFNSDGDPAPAAFGGGGGPGQVFLNEIAGFPYNATRYLDAGLRAQGYSATFISDGEAVTPEPATLLLLGGGLLGLVARRKRSKV